MAITEKDYSYVDADDFETSEPSLSEIRIDADNAWHGVQLKFGRVTARIIKEDDQAELSFDFSVTNQDADVAEELGNDTDFQTYVGDILTHIINTAFDKGDYRIGGDDDTNNNSAESASQ